MLGHGYNTALSYSLLSFAKFSPDGRYVLFTSDMNGSPRSDLFLAELPTGSVSTEGIVWTNIVYATANGNSLSKTPPGCGVGCCDGCADAGATSNKQIASGDSGLGKQTQRT